MARYSISTGSNFHTHYISHYILNNQISTRIVRDKIEMCIVHNVWKPNLRFIPIMTSSTIIFLKAGKDSSLVLEYGDKK